MISIKAGPCCMHHLFDITYQAWKPDHVTWGTRSKRAQVTVGQAETLHSVFWVKSHCPQTNTWPPHPSQRSLGCSTIIEKRGVNWSQQHPGKTGPSRWRGCSHCSHNNLQQDWADRRMANPMDPVLSHYTSQERQPAAVPRLLNNQPHQSPKHSHAEEHTEQHWSHKWRR